MAKNIIEKGLSGVVGLVGSAVEIGVESVTNKASAKRLTNAFKNAASTTVNVISGTLETYTDTVDAVVEIKNSYMLGKSAKEYLTEEFSLSKEEQQAALAMRSAKSAKNAAKTAEKAAFISFKAQLIKLGIKLPKDVSKKDVFSLFTNKELATLKQYKSTDNISDEIKSKLGI